MRTLLGKKLVLGSQKPSSNLAEDFRQLRSINDADLVFHDPFSLPDMQAAIDRIMLAQKNKERVMIFGDYDVDGVSSTAALFLFLRDGLNLEVSYRLPDRMKDGYGLKSYFVDEIAETGSTLLITVDCGSASYEEVLHASSKGIDTIITDHHHIQEDIPNALAVINPHRKEFSYPFPNLSGSGVVLKLIQALSSEKVAQKYIDLVTLGTVADCMPLVDENRLMVQRGLEQMLQSIHPCFRALLESKNASNLDADFIGYYIGPLINAAGRVESPYSALNMLLADNETAPIHIEKLKTLNDERKALSARFVQDALETVDDSESILIYEHKEMTPGVMGLVAGRLSNQFHKPAAVFAHEGENMVGSFRSPKYLNIVDILDQIPDTFIAYGGHAQAAGCTLPASSFDSFKEQIRDLVDAKVQDVDMTPILEVDMPVEIDAISLSLLDSLSELRPHGIGNPKPLFLIENFSPDGIEFLGREEKHLKLWKSGAPKIVAFNFGEYRKEIESVEKLGLVVELSRNEWNGTVDVQLQVKDFILQ